jgi:predicted AlkP superfamily phosphohydrolase/phosphomutase
MKNSKKVILIALDGADKHLLQTWADAGVLPNIRTLFDRATWCTVDNPPGFFAGSIWPSFYTGVSPAKHGKYCSNQLKSGTYGIRRVQGFDARCPTLWDVLGKQGKKVCIIDAPKASVSAGLNGIQIVDWATEDFDIALGTWPSELVEKIERDYGRNTVNEILLASEGDSGLSKLRGLLLERLRAKVRMTEDLLARDEWDFFFTLLTEVHTAGHMCWHLHDDKHPRYDKAQADRIGDIIRDIYIATDAAIGKFLKITGPDKQLIIYSCNGMGANYTGNIILDDILLGIDAARLSPTRRRLTSIANSFDRLTPSRFYKPIYPVYRNVRRALSLPVRDPEYRTAFRAPSNHIVGGVRINLVGREPNGTVQPEDYESICHELRRLIYRVNNIDTGKPIAKKVILTHEIYSGEHLDELPDIMVEWMEDAPILEVTSPDIGTTVRRKASYHRSGDHRPDGILFSVSESRGRGLIENMSIYDMAPTLAALAGASFHDAEGIDVSNRFALTSTL